MEEVLNHLIEDKTVVKIKDIKRNEIHKQAYFVNFSKESNEITVHWVRFDSKWDEVIAVNELKNRLSTNDYIKYFSFSKKNNKLSEKHDETYKKKRLHSLRKRLMEQSNHYDNRPHKKHHASHSHSKSNTHKKKTQKTYKSHRRHH